MCNVSDRIGIVILCNQCCYVACGQLSSTIVNTCKACRNRRFSGCFQSRAFYNGRFSIAS